MKKIVISLTKLLLVVGCIEELEVVDKIDIVENDKLKEKDEQEPVVLTIAKFVGDGLGFDYVSAGNNIRVSAKVDSFNINTGLFL